MDSKANGKKADGKRAEEQGRRRPRCLEIAKIRDSRDFANYMSALMSDLAEELITPGVGNAICNAGGKLLKVKEMELRYGTVGRGKHKVLELSSDDEDEDEVTSGEAIVPAA